jgi:CheY-like chemotaxis protein
MSASIGMIPTESGACFHLDMLEVENCAGAQEFDFLDDNKVLAPVPSQGKVLSIEDNSSNNHLMEKVLSLKAGMQLIICEKGEEAVELTMFHQPDVILLDLNLPGIQGEEVLQLLKQNPKTKHIPVIVVSANVTAVKVAALKSAGIVEFITKPIEVTKLLRTIESCLAKDDRKIA